MTSRISVQAYTVRAAIEQDLPAALARLATIGYTNVEPTNIVARGPEYAAALTATGMTSPSAHAKLIGQDQFRVFDAALTLGVQTVVDPSSGAERWTTRDGVVAVAESLNAAASVAADLGLRVGYHNHWYEFETNFDGINAYDLFAESLDPSVGLEVDAYWAAVAGIDVPLLLDRLGSRVFAVHVKDGPITMDMTSQTAVGDGRMELREIIAHAPADSLLVVELDEFEGDVFDALERSHRWLEREGLE